VIAPEGHRRPLVRRPRRRSGKLCPHRASCDHDPGMSESAMTPLNLAPPQAAPKRRIPSTRLLATLIVGVVTVGGLLWWAFHPSQPGSALVRSPSANAIVVSLARPDASHALPTATMAFRDARDRMGAYGATGYWLPPGNGLVTFPAIGVNFTPSVPPGVELDVIGDAQGASLSVLRQASERSPTPLQLDHGKARLPTQPGVYAVDVIGYWPEGYVHFSIYVTIKAG
jgi:hypothetical protein